MALNSGKYFILEIYCVRNSPKIAITTKSTMSCTNNKCYVLISILVKKKKKK